MVGLLFRNVDIVIVSEMTYNVSMGTLNPTIPYHTISKTFLLYILNISIGVILSDAVFCRMFVTLYITLHF